MFKVFFMVLLAVSYTKQSTATSLYNKESYRSLTSDKRATKVGDTVTIIVMESSEAGSSAGIKSESGFDMDAKANVDEKSWSYGIGIDGSNKGDAQTSRNGFIKSQITAVVVSVDDNDNLLIQGQQTLTIDGETQKIEITGKARKTDIFSNNTLLSSRLFDANIKYIGQGVVSDGKEPSNIYKFFKWLGLI